ncbi:MAG TPA: hypothetical protein VND45_08035 [Thermoanaerobaculia bacterium]|nr:hypothetical protein [Thermoanaerobaculia bacterium]
MVTDFDSTLIRRGVSAATLTDMADFVETIQQRPLDKLLGELPGLASLSQTKFSLARQVIRRRAKSLDRFDFEQLRVMADEVARTVGSEVGERIRSLFSFA